MIVVLGCFWLRAFVFIRFFSGGGGSPSVIASPRRLHGASLFSLWLDQKGLWIAALGKHTEIPSVVTSRPPPPPRTTTAASAWPAVASVHCSLLLLFVVPFTPSRSINPSSNVGSTPALQRRFRGEALGFLPLLRRRRYLCGGIAGPSAGENIYACHHVRVPFFYILLLVLFLVFAGGANPRATVEHPARALFTSKAV